MVRVNDNGRILELRNKIGGGAEADVYHHPAQSSFCIKVFRKTITSEQVDKIYALSEERYSALRSNFAVPTRIVKDTRGQPCGFVMSKFDCCGQLHELTDVNDRTKHSSIVDSRFLMNVAIRLAEGLAKAHSLGIVIGDLSNRNLGFTRNGEVIFFDVDSSQIKVGSRVLPARMGVPEFIDPRGRDENGRWKFDKETDQYALCLHIFKIFFRDRHPFVGAIPVQRNMNVNLQPEHLMTMGWNINEDSESRRLPVKRREDQPATSDILPRPLSDWLNQIFSEPMNKDIRIPASKMANTLRLFMDDVRTCKHDSSHIWLTKNQECPWCKRLENFSHRQSLNTTKHIDVCKVANCQRLARNDSIWCDHHWIFHPTQQSQRTHTSTSHSSSSWLNSLIGYNHDETICGAKNKDGSECQRPPLKGRQRCHHHYRKRRLTI